MEKKRRKYYYFFTTNMEYNNEKKKEKIYNLSAEMILQNKFFWKNNESVHSYIF